MSPGETSLRVEWVRRCSEALERLAGDAQQKTDVAAVLVDLFLPDSQGIDTFERLFKAAPHVPILVLSAARDEAVAKQAVQRGAQDYLLKDRLDNYLLPKALGSMIDRAAIAEALFEEKERAQVTLNSIGDAVMSCDAAGRLTYLHMVAEQLTGRTCESAAGRQSTKFFVSWIPSLGHPCPIRWRWRSVGARGRQNPSSSTTRSLARGWQRRYRASP